MKRDHLDPPSIDETIEENERRIRARRRFEEQVRAELEFGSSIPEFDVEWFEMHHKPTRLDNSRILQYDEDNPTYGIF